MTILQMITARRRTLAHQLEGLYPKQWDTQSLCEAWTVREVVGHWVMTFTHSMPQALFGILRARGNWDRFSERASRDNATKGTDELIGMARVRTKMRFALRPVGYTRVCPAMLKVA